MKHLFRPFTYINKKTFLSLCFIELCLAAVLWTKFKSDLFPTPLMVLKALITLLSTRSFYDNLIVSTSLTFTGMGISILVSLAIGYSYMIPVCRLLTQGIVFFRFLPLSGLIFFFTVLSNDGHQLKVILLVFGIVPFLVSSFKEELDSINPQEYELCKTLRMNNWQAWVELVIIGRRDYVLKAMKINFAISWLMITMVEGLNRSEGGFGVYLNDSNRFRPLAFVLAVLLVLLILGTFCDFILGFIREKLFPYVKLQVMK